MPRQATGSIETHPWKDGRTVTFRARFRAYGRRWRMDFGTNHEGWNAERARVELERITGQVARGTWEPPAPQAPVELDRDETLHVTASVDLLDVAGEWERGRCRRISSTVGGRCSRRSASRARGSPS